MDLVDLMNETSFLGQEFLTWLWFQSESQGQITLPSGDIAILFQPKMRLESGAGEALEQITCKGGTTSDFQEAKIGMRKGKKIEQATVVISSPELDWRFTIKGSSLEISGVKLPKSMGEADADDNYGHILDRISLVVKLHDLLDELFGKFMVIRQDQNLWATVILDIRDWLTEETETV